MIITLRNEKHDIEEVWELKRGEAVYETEFSLGVDKNGPYLKSMHSGQVEISRAFPNNNCKLFTIMGNREKVKLIPNTVRYIRIDGLLYSIKIEEEK